MVSNETIYREASHYNSWYMGPKEKLAEELDSYLEKAETIDQSKYNLKGMIVPHAGIMWSGATAAWGFKHLKNKNIKRIFILGPSHFVEFKGCGFTTADYWKTPFCNLKVDHKIYEELAGMSSKKNRQFSYIPMELDEYEHSLEIQTPYLGYLLKDKCESVTIVPILTGKLSFEEEVNLAKTLLQYYSDDSNFFVISEDFCHWGKRHKFFYINESFEKIHESIEFLDNMGFDLIKKISAKPFKEYLDNWKNNLCGGGSPVTVYLSLVEQYIAKKQEESNDNINTMELRHYTKSDPLINSKDKEAVSYAVFLDYVNI